MDLFDQHRQTVTEAEAPLAARMRPRSLDEFVGQGAIVGPGRLLRRAIQADQLASLIFYGPPGTGKTTLARIIANTTKAHFIAINAVLSGVKEIRAAIAQAQERRGVYSQRTILFVDEVHRFNKSQQDALLPWVENGMVILIGATTENPYFEVNQALVSRSRLFQLKPLDEDSLRAIVAQTLTDGERGYGDRAISLEPAALDHLVNVANGDARALLNALELAIETTPPTTEGQIVISLTVAEESIQQRAVLYDKEGDAHFDTISAFIKSVRGSDPDAALYWLARMVYAGEDPRFILRRLLILASEDVGLADPQAIAVVNACAQAFDRVGLPEGRYPLAQATLYLATAPKSNSVMAFFDALATVEREREAEVPLPLRDGTRDRAGFGHGANYLYPHAYRDHWVAQQYLPAALQGQVFYRPSGQGYEAQIQTTVARQREAQLAALTTVTGFIPLEPLTFSPTDSHQERWLQRTVGQVGNYLGHMRARLFKLMALQRHHLVLDLNAGSGLLTWEAVRQVPEGGVYACVAGSADAAALMEASQMLPELARPVVWPVALADLRSHLASQTPPLRFDYLMGRNVLMATGSLEHGTTLLAQILQQFTVQDTPRSPLVLAESVPQQTQRLYELLQRDWVGRKLYEQVASGEEAIYHQSAGTRLTWNVTDFQHALQQAGITAEIQLEYMQTELLITPALINRWFSQGTEEQPTYADYLKLHLSTTAIHKIHDCFVRYLCHQTVPWKNAIAFIQGRIA